MENGEQLHRLALGMSPGRNRNPSQSVLGGEYRNGKPTVRIMGKNFSVDENGKLSGGIHVNPRVAVPFFPCVLARQGAGLDNCPFREFEPYAPVSPALGDVGATTPERIRDFGR
jgi:hypothetical protein